jgi:cation transport ATPase
LALAAALQPFCRPREPERFDYVLGRRINAIVDGATLVGNRGLLSDHAIEVPRDFAAGEDA